MMMKKILLTTVLLFNIKSLATTDSEEASDTSDKPVASVEITSAELTALKKSFKSENEDQLIKAASQILGKDPNHLLTLNTLGVHYFKKGKHGLAEIIFDRALKTDPTNASIYNNLGVIYLAQNDMRKAIAAFKKSLQLKSEYSYGAINLSSIYLEYKDYSRSLAPLEEGYNSTKSDLSRGDKNAVDIANNYALALIGTGDHSKARSVFKNILETQGRNPSIMLNYAILLVEYLNEKSEATRILSKLKFMADDSKILKEVDRLEKRLEKGSTAEEAKGA